VQIIINIEVTAEKQRLSSTGRFEAGEGELQRSIGREASAEQHRQIRSGGEQATKKERQRSSGIKEDSNNHQQRSNGREVAAEQHRQIRSGG
jgi:hypothetical protein